MNTTLPEIDAEIARLQKTRAELEQKEQEAADMKNLKKGDYLYCKGDISSCLGLTIGKIYQLTDNLQITVGLGYSRYCGVTILSNHGVEHVYSAHRFRPATEEEVDNHLIEEANKLGYVVGATVIEYSARFPVKGDINQITVFRNKLPETVSQHCHNHYAKTKQPFVVLHIKGLYSLPITECKLVKDEISILVDNTTYIAEFEPNYVKFGCAKIDNHTFLDIFKLLDSPAPDYSNVYIKGIQIGKGLFTSKQIREIVERIKTNSKHGR